MAGFRMHVGTSSALGAGYAGTLHTMYGVPVPTATVAGALCGFAGMLPDLDSDYGVPLREAMSFVAATIPVFLVNRFESLQLSRETIIIIAIGLYLFVRFGIGTMIRKFTVHRGMFHSIPAMLTFGGITYLLTSGWPTNERMMMAGGVMGGFFSHLLLDEIYAVEFKTGRWRTKKSFGTAMKLWGGNSKSNFAAYAKLAIVGMGVVGEPNVLKQFVANQPELVNKLNDAINIVGTIGQNDPQLSSQVNQLKNILGTLNPNTANQYPPQDGGGWPSTATSPASPPNNQYPYAAPNNASAAPNQYSQYPSQPPQQLPQAPPPSNQPSDWQQWPGANQSYSGNGQPAQIQNGYDTAQRPAPPYAQ
jgi:LexA-binding, inner membrane-associated putative hydrolase